MLTGKEQMEKLLEAKKQKSAEQGWWKQGHDSQRKHPAEKRTKK